MGCWCGRVYTPSGFEDACIEVESGFIKAITKSRMSRCQEVDLILPGFVDLHVHMRGLGQRHKGEWRTESLAALRGGVTVVVDMPNNVPRIDSDEALGMKLEEASRESYVDFLFYSAYPYLPDVNYVVGVKLFPRDLENDLNELFERASVLGKEVVVHAEDPLVLREAEKPTNPEDHWRAHPELAEELAVRRVLSLAKRHSTEVRIAHSTLPSTLMLVLEAKLCGVKATAEVTPHHILLSIEDSVKLGPLAKVNPPLRSREVMRGLRAMVSAGLADFLVTDHAPHSREEKSRPYEEMPPGIPWLDVMAPFLLTLVERGDLPSRVLDMYSLHPARHLNLKRGSIAAGSIADLVMLRKDRWVVKGDELSTKAKSTAIEGMELRWRVDKVMIRGELVYDDGPVVEEGFGRPAL